ncbi:anti-sigma factor [Frigidibacter sp. MR17.14]|uniref:anti-sigma factor n=1 Tax=Frigidibacter sp. MR17.14 TaxID=3126509 RepID=UPI003012C790
MTEDDRLLAADYVLGVAPAAERARAEARIRQDRAFAAEVEGWQRRLSGLDAEFAAVEPPAALLGRIENRLFGRPQPVRRGKRILGWLSGAVAAATLAAVLLWPAAPLRPIADLTAADLSVAVLTQGDNLIFRSAAPAPSARDYQLWIIRAGQPRSLGLLTAPETVVSARLEPGDVLAVSLEPTGGSPTGLPTGPVLATAEITEL